MIFEASISTCFYLLLKVNILGVAHRIRYSSLIFEITQLPASMLVKSVHGLQKSAKLIVSNQNRGGVKDVMQSIIHLANTSVIRNFVQFLYLHQIIIQKVIGIIRMKKAIT